VEANKALLRSAYEAVSRRDPGPLTEALSEDVVWTVIGTTRMSGTARGKKEVAEKIFVPLRASLSDAPLRFEIDRLIGEGEWVVMLARGYATTREGKPYNNTYAIVARFENGKIVEMTDYIDTALINEVLNP